MKKILAMVLLVSMLLALFGCSGVKTTDNQDPVSPEEPISLIPDEPEEAEGLDMLGYDCIAYFYAEDSFSSECFFWYEPGTAFYEMAQNRIKKIKDDFNCNFTIQHFSSSNTLQTAVALDASTGNHGSDLILMSYFENITGMIEANLMLPLNEYTEYIDIHNEAIYGPANITEPALANGKVYMISPYTHPERQLLPDSFLIFNDALCKATDAPDLREVHENKSWTWDFFEQFVTDFTQKEENKTVLYGMENTGYFGALALCANGFQLSVPDGDGGYKSGVNAPNVIETIDWIKKIRTEFTDRVKFNSSWDTSIQDLIDGKCYIAASEMNDLVGTVQYKMKDYGILPFPYGPSCEYGKQPVDTTMFGHGIDVCSEDPNYAAMILNAYCQPFEEYPTVDDALSIYDKMFFDEKDIDVLKELTAYSRYYYWGGDGISYLNTAINNNYKKKSATEIVASIADTMEEVVQKHVIPNMEYINQYFTK